MNDLIERTIDYLARQNIATEMHSPGADEALSAASGQDSVFVSSMFFVEKLTFMIEEGIIDQQLSGGQLFVNVHGFNNFLKRKKHYEQIDRLDNKIYVYGSDICPEWPFERAMPRTIDGTDPIRACWFTVYANKDTCYCLVARRISQDAGSDEKYKFRGFWTTKRQITEYVSDYLVRVVNSQYGT